MKNYASKKPSKFISYFDMDNLHGWPTSGSLPYGRFKWLKNVDNFQQDISPIGYILEVDFENPDELHLLHNDYPLAPNNLQFVMTIVKKLLTIMK